MPSAAQPAARNYRVGLIVPSSNTTMETEIPAMMRAREQVLPERFTFHSSRMRMKSVTKEELEAMDRDSDRCALELSDARMDAMGYACLVAIMSMGKGYHRESQRRLHEVTVTNGAPTPVITSAGALVEGLQAMGAKRVAIIAPYMKPLTRLVIRNGERAVFLSLEEVDRIEASQNYVRLHAGPAAHLLHVPMNTIEASLDPSCFVRIHRSHIVNLKRIKQIWTLAHGQYLVELVSGERLPTGRTYGERIKRLLSNPF